jgi:hypothetical protein
MTDMGYVFINSPQQNYSPLTGPRFRLGGGSDMISEGDYEGFWHILDEGMR